MKFLSSETLSPNKHKTPEGYLVCSNAILARCGKQEYMKKELWGGDDDTIINVDRPKEEVMNKVTLASFEGKPVTIEHPEEDVNPSNYKKYAVGYATNIREGEDEGEPVIIGDLVIYDLKAIELIESGQMVELSCGYDCEILDEEDPKQTKIRGNHIALCEAGRAGNARIVDSKKKIKDSKKWIVYDANTDEVVKIFNNYADASYFCMKDDRELLTEEVENSENKVGQKIIFDSNVKDSYVELDRGDLDRELGINFPDHIREWESKYGIKFKLDYGMRCIISGNRSNIERFAKDYNLNYLLGFEVEDSIQDMSINELESLLDKSPNVSFAWKEGNEVHVETKWGSSYNQGNRDYVAIRSMLRNKLGDNYFDIKVREKESRDNGKEFCWHLIITLKGQQDSVHDSEVVWKEGNFEIHKNDKEYILLYKGHIITDDEDLFHLKHFAKSNSKDLRQAIAQYDSKVKDLKYNFNNMEAVSHLISNCIEDYNLKTVNEVLRKIKEEDAGLVEQYSQSWLREEIKEQLNSIHDSIYDAEETVAQVMKEAQKNPDITYIKFIKGNGSYTGPYPTKAYLPEYANKKVEYVELDEYRGILEIKLKDSKENNMKHLIKREIAGVVDAIRMVKAKHLHDVKVKDFDERMLDAAISLIMEYRKWLEVTGANLASYASGVGPDHPYWKNYTEEEKSTYYREKGESEQRKKIEARQTKNQKAMVERKLKEIENRYNTLIQSNKFLGSASQSSYQSGRYSWNKTYYTRDAFNIKYLAESKKSPQQIKQGMIQVLNEASKVAQRYSNKEIQSKLNAFISAVVGKSFAYKTKIEGDEFKVIFNRNDWSGTRADRIKERIMAKYPDAKVDWNGASIPLKLKGRFDSKKNLKDSLTPEDQDAIEDIVEGLKLDGYKVNLMNVLDQLAKDYSNTWYSREAEVKAYLSTLGINN